MNALSNPLQMAVNIIYVVFAVIILLGLLRGLRKGLYKSIADVIFVIIGAALSFVIARLVSQTFTDVNKLASLLESVKKLFSKFSVVVDFIETVQAYLAEFAGAEGAVNLIMTIPVVIICPILFSVIYILLGIILKIPKLLIERLIFGPNGGVNYKGGNRLLGGIVGGVRTLLSFAILIVPIIGFINMPGVIADAAKDAKPTEDGKTASYTEYLREIDESYLSDIKNNVALKTVYNCGGKWMFNSLSTIKAEGIKVSLTKDLCSAAKMEASASYFYGVKIEDYGEEQEKQIENIKNAINESDFMPTLVSGTLSYVSRTWLDGKSILGLEKIDVGEYYQPTFDEILGMCAQMNTETAKEDISTIATIARITIDSGLLKEIGDENGNVIEIVSGEKFMTDLVLALYDNVRTRRFIEMGSNALINYVYKLYDEVNNTTTDWCEQIDLSNVGRDEMRLEALRLASIISAVDDFTQSVVVEGDEDVTVDFQETFLQSDIGSLGRALDLMKQSVLFENSYEFILGAVLRSEAFSELGIFNEEVIQLMLDKDTNLETMLVSRQQLARLANSVGGMENASEAIKLIIKNITPEEAETIKKTLTPEALGKFGSDKSEALSKTLTSVVDSLAEAGDMSDEQLEKEAQAIDKMVTVAKASSDSDAPNIFSKGADDESKSGMTADDLVSSVMDSEIMTSSIKKATTDEDGNKVEDPYKISSGMSEEDKQSATDAINNYYEENKTAENDEEMKEDLSSLASILGIDPSELFK